MGCGCFQSGLERKYDGRFGHNSQRRMNRNASVGSETNLHLYWKDITMES